MSVYVKVSFVKPFFNEFDLFSEGLYKKSSFLLAQWTKFLKRGQSRENITKTIEGSWNEATFRSTPQRKCQ